MVGQALPRACSTAPPSVLARDSRSHAASHRVATELLTAHAAIAREQHACFHRQDASPRGTGQGRADTGVRPLCENFPYSRRVPVRLGPTVVEICTDR